MTRQSLEIVEELTVGTFCRNLKEKCKYILGGKMHILQTKTPSCINEICKTAAN